jgi:hypothetical protein
MAKLIKISDTTAFRISVIQMGKNVKGEPKQVKRLSVRQMYCTKKDPTWKPGYAGMTISFDIFERIVKAMNAVYNDPEQKIEIIEKKPKGKE